MQNIDKVLAILKADITNVTPSFASLIDPSLLCGIMVGGETLNTRLLQDFAPFNPQSQDTSTQHDPEDQHVPRGIYNGYGPTEVAIYSIAQAHVPANQRGSVIGTPLATCGALIVDHHDASLRPVPMGAVGELVLTGPQVSRAGYLNRPDETAKAFVDDAKWGRTYRTGDRARVVWGPTGERMVEFLGRMSDDQVKLSGRRVELGEIESVLATKVQDVHQTLACAWKPQDGAPGSERVVSLIVLDPKTTLDLEQVQARCVETAQKYLPEYMRPFRILQVDALPRSASGKVDRKVASAFVRNELQYEMGNQAPAAALEPLGNPEDVLIETQLLTFLSAIVNDGSSTRVELAADTPFVQVGIDSLRAMRLLRYIRSQWPDQPHLQPTLASLLEPLATIRSTFFASEGDGANAPRLDKRVQAKTQIADFASRHTPEALTNLGIGSEADIVAVVPATSTQSQLAVSFAMDKRNYISHTVLSLKPDVSLSALEEAIEAVLMRHDIYRTVMMSCDDPLSPFAQVTLTHATWQRRLGDGKRVVRRKTSDTENTQVYLDVAHDSLDFESQRLYYLQLVERGSGSESQFVISVAHCICDGASLEALIDDIARQYAGLAPLSRLGVQDAVQDWIMGMSEATDKAWQQSLAGWEAESFHALSGDNIKTIAPGVQADHGHAMVQISSALSWHDLESKSRSLGASPLSVLQAAWSVLLQVFSEANTGDIVFGSVLSGQHEAVQAPTFSVVPCRVDLPDSQTVHQLIDNLNEKSRFAQSHRHTSFGIFETLPYNTALALQAYTPPGHVLSRVQETQIDIPWSSVSNPPIRYDFDIFAEVLPTSPLWAGQDPSKMTFKLTYRDDALSRRSAQCVVEQLESLTKILLRSKPDDLVQGLPARLPRQLLSAEGTLPESPQDDETKAARAHNRIEVLHAQFEDQAASTPDLLALSFYTSLDAPPSELTYAELDARANGLANILREEDVDVIPICMQRSVELYVSILAILKAGSAWSPIDETSPVQRRTSLIARTQGKVLLTDTASYHLVEPCLTHESLANVRVILVDQYKDRTTATRALPRQTIQSDHSHVEGQDLAYLLWTSGTTGEPKGVMLQHFAAANAMRDLQVQVEHEKKHGQVRTLQLSAYSFDVFVQDLFFTWGLAGSVVSGSRELVLGTFTEFVNKSRPTHAHLTPSFGASINVEEIRGSTLQYVTFIGEKLTEDVAEAWAAPGITTKAYNTYGPAENAVVSTMRQFFGTSRDRAKAANVGFPLTPCTAYVVREVESPNARDKKHWELVPRYGVGELALGGSQIAKGYLNNPAKTTKAFIQGGLGIDERIYLTGDMVRLNDHGFEFLGRNDDLVKITGIRIELSEISAACASVKDVEPAVEHAETLYLPRPGADGTDANHKVVVTFVSVKKEHDDLTHLRKQVFQRAREMLPTYMVPGHIVVLNTTMPRTASNKVDRKALQNIYNDSDLNELAAMDTSPGGASGEMANWAPEQLLIIKTISENIGIQVEPLSPKFSLAGLGISSLQVTKLAWALRRQLGCTVGVLDLMRCQTLGDLVHVIYTCMGKDAGTNTAPEAKPEASWVTEIKEQFTRCLRGDMRPAKTSYIIPATPAQEALIVETMIEPRAYWSHRLFDLSHLDDVDVDRLHVAWTDAAKQFDILRTIFAPLWKLEVNDGGAHPANSGAWARRHGVQSSILQLVQAEPMIHWTVFDRIVDDQLATHAEALQADLTPCGSNATNPPWAVTYSKANSKLMLSMHHALHDGASSAVVIREVADLYQNSGKASGVHNSPLQFDKGLELGLLSQISAREEAVSVWTRRFSEVINTHGAVNGSFPDLTRSRRKQERGILSSHVAIPTQLVDDRPKGIPDLPRLLQSALGVVLASYMELKAIVLGQNLSQRILHPDLARVVGPAMATLPVIVRADGVSSAELWAEMAQDSSNLSQSAHRLHPVDIKKMINEGNGDSKAPFPALFVYHPSDTQVQDGSHMFRETGQALSLNVEHPLALNIYEADNTIHLTGDGRRISQAQLDLMLRQILDQARAMVDHPQLPLHRLPNTMRRNLVSIAGEITTFADAQNPADRVATHAAEHPDWIATEEISFEEDEEGEDRLVTKTLTYAQLHELVDAIMLRLRSHEAKLQPDDVVALYLDRDTKSLAAILAIFRAGFVYLPIDNSLPATRKQLLVRDAGAKLVVSAEELIGELHLDQANDPPLLLLPAGDDELEAIRAWSKLDALKNAGLGMGGYLLYTSGSTGRPKGVRVSNDNLLHFISAFSARLVEASPETASLGGRGKYLNVASRAFDPHLTSMFVPWHLGFRAVIGKDRNAIFANLKQVINDLAITHMGSVPSVLIQLGIRLEDVPSIRVLTTGGEKASNELFDVVTSGRPPGVLMNFYGPTEVTIGCLGHAVSKTSNSRNLGLPLQGLQAILLAPDTGDEQIIARRGQPGELCISGPQVSLGYLDRPEENSKAFQTTALLGPDRKVIYRTGDIMRMMEDGSVEFLGRKDQQTKIRGQRFEIGEVEAFIKKVVANEGPLDVAATVVDQKLLGFLARSNKILLKSEKEADPVPFLHKSEGLQSILRNVEQRCEEGLPAFMVPEIIWVSRIPYLPASGKVDTKSLIKLANDFTVLPKERGAPSTTSTSAPPLDGREIEVVAALEEAVGMKLTATSTSTIHSLGVDSLSAMHLLSILGKKGLSKITMEDLLTPSCTIGSIARSIVSRATTHASPTRGEVTPMEVFSLEDLGPCARHLGSNDIEAILPSLPLQSSLASLSLLWLSSSEDTSDAAVPYVTQFNYRLAAGTDLAKWKRVAETVISAEAMLRTCFVQRYTDGRVFQVVLRSPPSPFDGKQDAIDLTAYMTSRPPLRVQIQECEDSKDILVTLKIHHALFDGAAIDVLRGKLERAYIHGAQVVVDNNASLSKLKSLSSHCNLTHAQLDSMKRAWQQNVRDIRPCLLGAHEDNAVPNTMARTSRHFAYTQTELKSKLHLASSGEFISASTAFQLATTLCLAHLTKTTSLAYGFVMSLRPLLTNVVNGVHDFVGPCLNTLIHAIKLESGDETLPNLAARIRQNHGDTCQGCMPLVTADKIQRWAGLDEKLFDSLLTINVMGDDDLMQTEVAPGRMVPLPGASKSDMSLSIDVDLHADGGISLLLSSAGVLAEAQLEELAALFEKAAISSADQDAAVKHFSNVSYRKEAPVVIDHEPCELHQPKEAHNATREFKACLAIVQTSACRLLDLDEADVKAKDPAKTSLYQLGLDSINVLPFVRIIHKAEGIKLPPNSVIKAKTIQGVAALLHDAKGDGGSRSLTSGRTATDSNNNPLQHPEASSDEDTYTRTLERLAGELLFVATPLQEGMLSASMAIEGQAYTYTHTMQLSQMGLDEDAPSFDHLFAAIKDTVQACEILRTRFIFTQNDTAPWVGVVSPTEQSDLVNWDVSQNGVLQLRIHHALYDATSISTMWRLLNEYYTKRLLGHGDADVEIVKHDFRHFAKQSAASQKPSVAFWTDLVRSYTYAPIEFPLLALQASSAFHFTLNADDLSRLQAKCRASHVTLKSALQLAWAKVLCESLYQQLDVVFGEVISAGNGDGTVPVVGPTINTVPMRVTLAAQSGVKTVAEALSQLQSLSDDARGTIGMASLRAVQAAWRSAPDDENIAATSLFQSLFVFDGVLESEPRNENQALILPAHEQSVGKKHAKPEERPAFDDYPLIVSFRVKGGVLHGKLRAKLPHSDAMDLGAQLQKALQCILSEDLQSAAVRPDCASRDQTVRSKQEHQAAKTIGDAPTNELNGLTGRADAIMSLVSTVVGDKANGKPMSYNTKLVNAGIDSITAIRFSQMLKKQFGIRASVFEIIQGASVHDLVKKSSPTKTNGVQQHRDESSAVDRSLIDLAASKLDCSRNQIKSISPVLPGQRGTLSQWLRNGKRFFEAPWAYLVTDRTVDAKNVASCWSELCNAHDILRTTFVCAHDGHSLLQVTLDNSVSAKERFTHICDSETRILALIEAHVRDSNDRPSDLMKPPARLSFLQASDGNAVVLRVHHALYDAWSIKMIQRDLASLLASESVPARTSIESAVRQVQNIQHPEAQGRYWQQHLANAQDTMVSAVTSGHFPFGQRRELTLSDILPPKTASSLAGATSRRAHTSAAIVISYARALGQLTDRSHPTFGINHASRSLSSVDGEQTLDLTGMSIPTMTVTPMTLDLESRSNKKLFDQVQTHLAQLSRFSQADDLHKISPRFNSFINILYPEESSQDAEQPSASPLQRYKLGEPLASEYFTKSRPSLVRSTIDELDTSHLHDSELYFNVLVHPTGNISVKVSGNEELHDEPIISLAECFCAQLGQIVLE
ncbi:peptide synthetase [Emericellopsis cladophorae]|uniref:Peptide synthetase n=1 Tax=Emericellopsis cladophorae TaxID=2686198 RepID=A0A9P9XVU4_9HYPO|nr:peptide synthetase [Emericellopsis cladophorae]KAI6778380.1 peptide synthetase [Emericellopsis cladophorae]